MVVIVPPIDVGVVLTPPSSNISISLSIKKIMELNSFGETVFEIDLANKNYALQVFIILVILCFIVKLAI